MKLHRLRAVAVVALVATGLGPAACSSGSGDADEEAPAAAQDGPGQAGDQGDEGGASEAGDVLGYDEMLEEMFAARDGLEVPPGAEWPDPPPEPEPQPDSEGVLRGTSYEVGLGRSVAEGAWFCLWSEEWLEQRGVDPERESRALEMMLRLQELDYYQQDLAPAAQERYDDLLQQAELGDPSGIANDVELNCSA